MKKTQMIVMAMFFAMTAGVLFLAGCSTDTNTETVPVSGGTTTIPFDKVVNTVAGLKAALANPDYTYIGVAGTSSINLTEAMTIPEAKKVYLYAPLATGSSALSVEGSVVIAVDGSLTATSSGKVSVKGEGSLRVEEGGLLTIDVTASVDDGADSSPATAFGSSKVVIAGGGLTYTSVSDVSDIETALGYISSGGLSITTTSLKPSQVVAVRGVSSAKRLSANLGSTSEDATTLTIPVGFDITTTGTLSSADVTVYGELTASANPKSLTIKEGATVNGIIFPAEPTNAELATNSVTIENIALTGTLDIGSGSTLIVTGTNFRFAGGGAVTGSGKIKTDGSGSLVIGPHGGFTTTTNGVTGSELMTLASPIIMEAMRNRVLTNKVALDSDTFFDSPPNPAVSAIGSVTISNTNATTIQNTGNASTGSNLILNDDADTTITFSATVTGNSVSGKNADNLTAANFTLTAALDTDKTVVKIADSDFASSGTDKYGVVTFTGVKLKNGELIGPALTDFKVGVKTKRADT
jgi:hypothetical protein